MSVAALDQALAGAAISIFDGEVDEVLADLDHEQEIVRHIADLEALHDALLKTERKVDRITDRLADPELADQFPPGSPEWIEADDLRSALNAELLIGYSAVTYLAGMIKYHGRHIYGQRDLIAQRLHKNGAAERICMTVPGILTTEFYQQVIPQEEEMTDPEPEGPADPSYAQVPF